MAVQALVSPVVVTARNNELRLSVIDVQRCVLITSIGGADAMVREQTSPCTVITGSATPNPFNKMKVASTRTL
jgi:hypothetical protein